MTLIATFVDENGIWICADRKLSQKDGEVEVQLDATKIVILEALDGFGVMGYCGLGATAKGNEVSEWMGRVLFKHSVGIEEALEILARAIKIHVPKHLATTAPGRATQHQVVLAGFVNDEPCSYELGLFLDSAGKIKDFKRERKMRADTNVPRPEMFDLIGSGSGVADKFDDWRPIVKSLAKRVGAGEVPAERVADVLAEINFRTSRSVGSVGEDAIVVWRDKQRGGGHQYYCKDARVPPNKSFGIPTIGRGMDISALMATTFENIFSGGGMPMSDEELQKKFWSDDFQKAIDDSQPNPADEKLE